MIKTITDPMQVKVGDKAYFKGCDFVFTVTVIDVDDKEFPIAVYNPLSGCNFWIFLPQFDHATREVEEPEWPDPHEAKLHVYLGSDGVRYIYNPADEHDKDPWLIENRFICHTRETMGASHPDALPLTELKLVPVKDDDNE